MRKYTSAPKAIADALKESVPVSEAAAFGDDWKKLPTGTGTRIKAGKRILEVSFGGVRLKLQGTPSESYAKGLAKVVKDYIKAHPLS